ncbi:centromere binding protein B [Colletotrichum tofieldiae]|uniref:Centromere binding protein B n=2 Tax=Colletotrichum spaethianum species complex TaxID=2707349 RepID=A0A166PUD5_9PEZI|nr:centromere binding protein B [Colletotrichum tofieldiae]GJC78478.1 CENP-B 1 [Colletotrichum liriopes]GKT61547.1 centromere binding protein B [Colletotrichum tofieldiae]GKT70395.1 centromere binding protein B [Colletotrichum tofieldiae]
MSDHDHTQDVHHDTAHELHHPSQPDVLPGGPGPDGTESPVSTPKERSSLSLDQRRALRRWANAQTIRPSHKACIDWFYNQYGQHISQSTVSHSLSPKYSRLDGDNPQLSGSRLRFGNWPDVEKLVLRWYQQVQATGRHPTNEELGEKAKAIFTALPRYKEETPPEFSPGWIHRFKKRYGLLIRRQRRHGEGGMNPAEDIGYLADCVPRLMALTADTSPAAIREAILRSIGVETSLQVCALVRDEVLRRLSVGPVGGGSANPISPSAVAPTPDTHSADTSMVPPPASDTPMYGDEDPDIVLQNALRQLQQEEAEAEATAAAAREEREQRERAQGTAAAALATPAIQRATSTASRFVPSTPELNLTPIKNDDPVSANERPLRCPFCVNQRMLRTIKEAVEHMSTHVVV